MKNTIIFGVGILAVGAAVYARSRATMQDSTSDNMQPSEQGSDSTTTTDYSLPAIEYWVSQNATEIEAQKMPEPTQNASALSAAGLDKIKAFEGFSATAYPDHKGNSIGYGHLIKAGDGLSAASRVTKEQALELLASDVKWAVAAVNQSISVALTQKQFDALVSFCFNVGEGAFKSSTLVKRINAGDTGASAEFARWVNASGSVNSALVARRAQERADFEATA